MNARKKLDEIATKLAGISEKTRELDARHADARRRVDELHNRLSDAIEVGAVGMDWSTMDESVEKLHAEIATAKAAASPDRWRAERDGLDRARAKLESERQKISVEHFDALAAELVDGAGSARKLLDDAIDSVEKAATVWNSLAARWLDLERAADLGRSHATRLDVPPFPLSLTGDLDAQPIPFTLANADPTITSAA